VNLKTNDIVFDQVARKLGNTRASGKPGEVPTLRNGLGTAGLATVAICFFA
jgi:hypothetical protein